MIEYSQVYRRLAFCLTIFFMRNEMFHILIEENYSENNIFHKLLEGITSVAKKKHEEIAVYKSTDELPKDCRVAIIICQSLKWSTDRIGELNMKNIHPLVFGFQYLDTMYKYSSIAPNYTKSAYRLTKYALSKREGKIAVVGYNEDSLPDRLKYMGIKYAINEVGADHELFRNNGDVISCLNDFASRGDEISNIVCCNDNIAVMLYNKYPEIVKDRAMCSCSGIKISEYFENSYPVCRIDYFEAGIQLAKLYRFLIKQDVIYSTVMTFDMDLVGASVTEDIPMVAPPSTEIYSMEEVDFYGDKSFRTMEALDNMLSCCDETDLSILYDITCGSTYEKIAERHYLAINTVKYRVKKMLDYVGADSRRSLIALLDEYGIKFKKNNKTE